MDELDAYLADCYFARVMGKGSYVINVRQMKDALQKKPELADRAREKLTRLDELYSRLGTDMSSRDFVGSVHRDALREALEKA